MYFDCVNLSHHAIEYSPKSPLLPRKMNCVSITNCIVCICPMHDLTEGSMSGTFEVYKDKKGHFRFRLKSSNGEILISSQGYTRKDSCLAGIESVKKNAPDADITELNFDRDLLVSADSGNIAGIKKALKLGANPNCRDLEGETPLIEASESGNLEAVKILLKNGAALDLKDREGETALHEAVEEGHAGIVRYLIKSGAKTGIPDNKGNTPLHVAVLKNSAVIVKLLINCGAKPSVKNRMNQTPLDLAHENSQDDIITILKAKRKTGIKKPGKR